MGWFCSVRVVLPTSLCVPRPLTPACGTWPAVRCGCAEGSQEVRGRVMRRLREPEGEDGEHGPAELPEVRRSCEAHRRRKHSARCAPARAVALSASPPTCRTTAYSSRLWTDIVGGCALCCGSESSSQAFELKGLFSHMTPAQRTQVYDLMTPRTMAPGTELMKQGDNGDTYFVIESGTADVYVHGPGEVRASTLTHAPPCALLPAELTCRRSRSHRAAWATWWLSVDRESLSVR